MITNFETLTRREKEILELVTMGLSNKEIMLKCKLSQNTIKTYLGTLYLAYGVSGHKESCRSKLILARQREKQKEKA